MSDEVIEYAKCPETGLKITKRYGLVPLVIDIAIPERAMSVGEIHGVLPVNAVIMIKNGYAHVHGEHAKKAPAKAD